MATQHERFSVSEYLLSGMVFSAILAVKFWIGSLGNPDNQPAPAATTQNFRPPFELIQLPQSVAVGSDRKLPLDALLQTKISPSSLNDSINIVAISRGEARSAEQDNGVQNLVELMKTDMLQQLHPTRCAK